MRPFNLQEFKSKAILDLASPARFSVIFVPPPILQKRNSGSAKNEKLTLYCKSVSIPSINLNATETRTYGMMYSSVYGRSVDSVDMTFLVDNTWYQRYFFENWVEAINSFETNNVAYYKEYVTNITIDHYSYAEKEEGTPKHVYSITLQNAYPSRVDATNLDWGKTDDILEQTVLLTYENLIVKRPTDNEQALQINWTHLDKEPMI